MNYIVIFCSTLAFVIKNTYYIYIYYILKLVVYFKNLNLIQLLTLNYLT